MPEGSSLFYEWKVVSGDASSVTFGDAQAKNTTFTARAKGLYVICLTVSDGETVTYSDPVEINVIAPGLVINLQ